MTTTAKGALGQVLVIEEATYKTTPASPTFFKIPVLSEDISTNQNQLANEELRANRSQAAPILGNKDIRGTIRPTLHLDAIGHWFNWGVGAPTTIAAGTVANEVTTGSPVVLDDMTSNAGANYTGTDLARYEFTITTAGAQDKFKWQKYTINSLGVETAGALSAEIDCAVAPTAIADGLTVTFGAITGHAVTDAWTVMVYGQHHHTFKITTSLNTFQIERGLTDTADYFLLKGCMVESLGLTLTPEGVVSFDLGVLGSSFAFDTSTAASAVTSYTSNVESMFKVAGILEGGSAITNVAEMSFTLNNNPEGIFVVGGQGEFGVLEPSATSVSGTLTTLFQDQAILTKAINNTESSLVTAITNDAATEWVRFSFNEVKYQPQAPTLPNAQVLRNQLPWIAYYGDDSGASSFEVILFGGSASY